MGHEVGIVALVASRVERLFLRTLTKTVAVVAESRWTCTRTVIQDGCRRYGLRVEESFAHVQTVELFAVVAISRETSTSTDGCDSCSGCKE